MRSFTLICACNDEAVLQTNLLASPCIAQGKVKLLAKQGYHNVCRAYNNAVAEAATDLVCFVHQDVYLPEGWEQRVFDQIARLDALDPSWAVAGCAGARLDGDAKTWLGHLEDRGKIFGGPEGLPGEVMTLDEVVLICRRKDAEFDEWMPNHHLIGAELCLRHLRDGRKAYAIDAYCSHRSTQSNSALPGGFALGAGYLYAKYPDCLPIAATCATIHRIDGVCVLTL